MKRLALFLVLSIIFLEWLDFSLYLYLAKAVFAPTFFPESAHSLVLTFALFATAYVARPAGAWFLGRQADIAGRRKPMVLSAELMGLATLGIALLPSYAHIGFVAPWVLLGLRCLQGLALGGEIHTSALFLIEHHPKAPLTKGSLAAASGAAGMFLGGMIAALIQSLSMPWLWRILFVLFGGISLWVCSKRKQLQESPEFQQLIQNKTTQTTPFAWPTAWRGIRNIAVVGAYVSTTVYLCNAFWVNYATDQHLWSNVYCTWAGSLAQLLSAAVALPIAHFLRPHQATACLKASMVIVALMAPLLFYATGHHWTYTALTALLGYVMANGCICASLYYFLYQQLPTQHRCQGVSTAWSLAAIIGALALPIAQQAIASEALQWVPSFLISGIAVLSFIFVKPITQRQNVGVYVSVQTSD